MAAEDVITTEEVLVDSAEVVQVETEVQLQDVKEILLHDARADSEAIVVQHQEKVVLEEEANLEAHLLQELTVSQAELQDVKAVLQKDQQDVLKVLAMHQEKEDREEAKFLTLIPLTWEGIMELKISTFC